MGAEIASLLSKFAGFSRNFKIVFIPWTPVSEIFGTLFEALFLKETLRERIPSQERIPSRAS